MIGTTVALARIVQLSPRLFTCLGLATVLCACAGARSSTDLSPARPAEMAPLSDAQRDSSEDEPVDGFNPEAQVGGRIYVVARGTPKAGERVPTELASQLCPTGDCRLLAAPMLIGRSGHPMQITMADASDGHSLKFKLYLRNGARTDATILDVSLKGRIYGPETNQEMKFTGGVPARTVTHLGTMHDRGTPGAEVYGVFVSAPEGELVPAVTAL